MTSLQWQDALDHYRKHKGDYQLGYLAGLLEGSFVIPHDIDPELFVDYLIEYDYDPFDVGFGECVAKYRDDAAENFYCS